MVSTEVLAQVTSEPTIRMIHWLDNVQVLDKA